MNGRLTVHTRRHPYTYVTEASVQALLADLYGGHDLAEMMTYSEAAAELAVTIQAVRRLIQNGELTRVGRGRQDRTLRSAVETVGRRRA